MSLPIVGVIDIGSNSIKLLVARKNESGILEAIYHASDEVRLSRGISQDTLSFSEAIMDQAKDSVVRLLHAARSHQATRLQIVATSAVRDAVNQSQFSTRILEATGYPVHVLSGEQEAYAIANGILNDPNLEHMQHFWICDLGGGSMELIHYQNKTIQKAISLPIGTVRLTERFIEDPSAPMSREAACAIEEYVSMLLHASHFQFPITSAEDPVYAVITGGAMTAVKNILDASATLPCIPQDSLERLFVQVATQSLHERLRIRGLPKKRADIFPAGLAILLSLMRFSKAPSFYHSYYGLRFGIASQLLKSTIPC